MRKKLLVAAVIAGLVTIGVAAPAQARNHAQGTAYSNTSTALLSVLHAVPNTPVDVYLDHVLTIDNFAPGTLQQNLRVDKGRHVVTITAATAVNDSAPVIGPLTIRLAPSDDYTLVAHLTEAGVPTATLFQNNNGTIREGKGLLTVRHVAAAGSVDVLAGGVRIVKDLSNPDEEELALPASTYSTTVALTGTTTPVLGPVDVPVYQGQNRIVYAWGSAADGTLAIATQVVNMEIRYPSTTP